MRVRRALLVTAVLTGCFTWAMVVFGLSFAMIERNLDQWWVVPPFGAAILLITIHALRAVLTSTANATTTPQQSESTALAPTATAAPAPAAALPLPANVVRGPADSATGASARVQTAPSTAGAPAPPVGSVPVGSVPVGSVPGSSVPGSSVPGTSAAGGGAPGSPVPRSEARDGGAAGGAVAGGAVGGSAPAGTAPAGGSAGSASDGGAVGGSVPGGAAGRSGDGLSVREIEVLRELAAGRTNAEIAAALFVAPGTVKAHLNHIFRKLGATSRLQAVAYARAAGLLD
ncbi:response regulator transcription factor [Cryptosporangium sp. NPDC048952]|uniref:response regulator transcription factor n=1 Tax=Cryptosporangium sp. NPDC048952 TaxID=3363961 RepID=UPI00371C8BEC